MGVSESTGIRREQGVVGDRERLYVNSSSFIGAIVGDSRSRCSDPHRGVRPGPTRGSVVGGFEELPKTPQQRAQTEESPSRIETELASDQSAHV